MLNLRPLHFMLLLIMTTHFHFDLKCQMNDDEHAEPFNLSLLLLFLFPFPLRKRNNNKFYCVIDRQTLKPFTYKSFSKLRMEANQHSFSIQLNKKKKASWECQAEGNLKELKVEEKCSRPSGKKIFLRSLNVIKSSAALLHYKKRVNL